MFSEAKLLEVTLSNLYRVELIWDTVISHFLEVRVKPCHQCIFLYILQWELLGY